MPARIKIEGPGINQELTLSRTGQVLTLGRDANSDAVLNDPERCISRRHLVLTDSGRGVEFRVTSSVNGIQTSRGAVEPGESIVLGAGDDATVGPYRLQVLLHEADPAGAAFPEPQRAMPSPLADDAFAAMLGTRQQPRGSTDVFDHLGPAAAPLNNPLPAAGNALDQLSGVRSPSGGMAWSPSSGPLGDLLPPPPSNTAITANTSRAPGMTPRSGGSSVDGFLQQTAPTAGMSGAAGGPLDQWLRGGDTGRRALAPDHVSDQDLPFWGSTPPATPPAPVAAPLLQPTPPLATPPAPTDALPPSAWVQLMGESGAATPPPSPGAALASAGASFQPAPPAHFPLGTPPDLGAATKVDDEFQFWPDSMGGALGALPTPPAPAGIDISLEAGPARAPSPVAAVPAAASPASPSGEPGLWTEFIKGLGLDPSVASNAESAERAGRMTRLLIEGLADLLAARRDLKRELRASDRTMMGGRNDNPLKLGLTPAELTLYLFGPKTGATYMPAEQAVKESIFDLRVHEHATIAASRAAVTGALRDFDPARLKKQLLKGKPGLIQLMDKAKLWDAYQEHHEKQTQQLADWLESMIQRHFMPAYELESSRMKRAQEEGPGP